VVLASTARASVKVGDHVKGGATVLAYLQPRESTAAGTISAQQKAH
jgi:hypothetical protein